MKNILDITKIVLEETILRKPDVDEMIFNFFGLQYESKAERGAKTIIRVIDRIKEEKAQ